MNLYQYMSEASTAPSDVERDYACQALRKAFSEGRIDNQQLEQRLHIALTATSIREINNALDSLPAVVLEPHQQVFGDELLPVSFVEKHYVSRQEVAAKDAQTVVQIVFIMLIACIAIAWPMFTAVINAL